MYWSREKECGENMKLVILRIEKRKVICGLDCKTKIVISVARRWFAEDIQEGDTIDLDMRIYK